jgi:CheY-like chemotaxis protein
LWRRHAFGIFRKALVPASNGSIHLKTQYYFLEAALGGFMNKMQNMEPIPRTQTHCHETILIVEDDEPLLRLLRFFLGDEGYNVLSANTGEEAVDIYMKHRREIDLVLTDLGLPGLTGKDEMLALGRINPDVRIICASGFIVPKVEAEMLQAGAKAIIKKPYAPQEILQKVRTVLDAC